MVVTDKITITSSDSVPEFIDITEKVARKVRESGVKNGQVLVFSQHTTAAVILQEPEERLLRDLRRFLCGVAPKDGSRYEHTTAPDHVKDEKPNGHSHCQHCFLGSSEVIPVVGGKLFLGQFQRIMLVELDRARTRNIVVQVIGE